MSASFLEKFSYKIKCVITTRRYKEILRRSHGARIAPGTQINDPSHFRLGNNSYINGGMFTTGPKSTITIGDDCLISYGVFMRTITHNYISKEIPINRQGHSEASIIVEDDVWVGYGALIAGGVTLHKGCVVGMGAVVTKDVPEYAVVAGCPARKIRERR